MVTTGGSGPARGASRGCWCLPDFSADTMCLFLLHLCLAPCDRAAQSSPCRIFIVFPNKKLRSGAGPWWGWLPAQCLHFCFLSLVCVLQQVPSEKSQDTSGTSRTVDPCMQLLPSYLKWHVIKEWHLQVGGDQGFSSFLQCQNHRERFLNLIPGPYAQG